MPTGTKAERELPAPGTQLKATYMGVVHLLTVESGENGALVYRLDGEAPYSSPTAAAKAVNGGKAVNGWAFFKNGSTEAKAPKAPKATQKAVKGAQDGTGALHPAPKPSKAAPKAKAAKEPKAKVVKEPKAKAVKQPKTKAKKVVNPKKVKAKAEKKAKGKRRLVDSLPEVPDDSALTKEELAKVGA